MIKLAEIFSDGAVLQRDMEIRVFGTADRPVTVTFDGNTVTVDSTDGKFCAILPAHMAGTGYTISVTDGENTVTVRDVSVGEVFIAAGQSNMEMPLAVTDGAEDELERCDNPNIHFYSIPQQLVKGEYLDAFRFQYMDHSAPVWKKCTCDTAKDFSAIGYYVAKKLQRALGVPVGVIGCNWGARCIETFIPNWAMERHPQLQSTMEKYQQSHPEHTEEYYKETYEQFKKLLAYHKTFCTYPPNVSFGCANFASYYFHNAWSKCSSEMGECVAKGPYYGNRPGAIYHTMLEDTVPYGVKFVLWYQGEDDTKGDYLGRYGVLVDAWREAFQNADMPFYAMELAPFGRFRGVPCDRVWPQLRQEQRQATLQYKNCHLVTSAGLGDIMNIHPVYKRELAYRAARSVLHNTYGVGPKAENPYAVSATFEKDCVRVDFANNERLTLLGGAVADLYISADGENFVFANAKIENDQLVAWAEGVENPTEIRYCYTVYYAGENIFNAAALPASPFRFVKE